MGSLRVRICAHSLRSEREDDATSRKLETVCTITSVPKVVLLCSDVHFLVNRYFGLSLIDESSEVEDCEETGSTGGLVVVVVTGGGGNVELQTLISVMDPELVFLKLETLSKMRVCSGGSLGEKCILS